MYFKKLTVVERIFVAGLFGFFGNNATSKESSDFKHSLSRDPKGFFYQIDEGGSYRKEDEPHKFLLPVSKDPEFQDLEKSFARFDSNEKISHCTVEVKTYSGWLLINSKRINFDSSLKLCIQQAYDLTVTLSGRWALYQLPSLSNKLNKIEVSYSWDDFQKGQAGNPDSVVGSFTKTKK